MKRRHYEGSEKVKILKEHYVGGKSISDVCMEYGIHVNLFHRWNKELWEGGVSVFTRETEKLRKNYEKELKRLEDQLRKKDEVVGELLLEYMSLKKKLGVT